MLSNSRSAGSTACFGCYQRDQGVLISLVTTMTTSPHPTGIAPHSLSATNIGLIYRSLSLLGRGEQHRYSVFTVSFDPPPSPPRTRISLQPMSIGRRLICYLRLRIRVVDQDHFRAFPRRSDLEHRLERRLRFDGHDGVLSGVDVYSIQHGSELQSKRSEGRGAKYRIWLPLRWWCSWFRPRSENNQGTAMTTIQTQPER